MRIQDTLKGKVLSFMREVVAEHIDPLTGEVNMTRLAEDAAWEFEGAEDWLDDPEHWIWEMAAQVAEIYEANQEATSD